MMEGLTSPKLVGGGLVLAMLSGGGGYSISSSMEKAHSDGQWKGSVEIKLEVIDEDIKEMKVDIKELLKRSYRTGEGG